MGTSRRWICNTMILACGIWAFFATAGETNNFSYHEDFSNTSFRNNPLSTAQWDTVNGVLRYPEFHMKVVGSVPLANLNSLAVQGDELYAQDSAYNGGLKVYEIDNPEFPELIGAGTGTGGEYMNRAVVDGDFAYTLTRTGTSAGVRIFDISTPATPLEIDYLPGMTSPQAIALDGDILVATGGSSLFIVDVSDPAAISFLTANFILPGIAYGVDLEGDILYVAHGGPGLAVVDISDPTAPTIIGQAATASIALAVVVSGDHAYVALLSGAITVFDVSTPTLPVAVGGVDLPGNSRGLTLAGDRLYVSSGGSGVVAVDVSDPQSPLVVDAVAVPGQVYNSVVAGEYLFASSWGDGIHVIDLDDRHQMYGAVGSVPLTELNWNVHVEGDVAYVAEESIGVHAIDISDPQNPVELDLLPCAAYAVDVAGDLGVVASVDGIILFDCTNPAALDTIAVAYGPVYYILDVEIRGNHVFAPGSNGELSIFDITDPSAPTVASAVSLATDHLRAIDVEGDWAYIAAGVDGLYVINVSDPTAPGPVYYQTPVYAAGGKAYDVVVNGNFAYVAEGNVLRQLDATDPTNLNRYQEFPISGIATGVAISGDQAYVCSYGEGLRYYETRLSWPNALRDSDLSLPGAYRVAVAGDHAFVAMDGGFAIERINDRRFDYDGLHAYTIPVTPPDVEIFKYRVTIDNPALSLLRYSTDDFATHTSINPDGTWRDLPPAANLALWMRLDYNSLQPLLVSPELDWLHLEWLMEASAIAAISDIPDDQGGFARLRFMRSAFDFAGEADPVHLYDVYRKIEGTAVPAAAEPDSRSGLPGYAVGDRFLVVADKAAGTFPPGVWEHVTSLGALQQDEYIAMVPTLGDSGAVSGPTSFVVVAHTTTPSTWYVSQPDSGWSVDNLAPGAPGDLTLASTVLNWTAPGDPDLQYFRIYGSQAGVFDESAILLGQTADLSFGIQGQSYAHFHLTALDFAGNESPAASTQAVSDVPGGTVLRTALLGNHPNPFNPRTKIGFELAAAARVRLEVYDLTGRLVRTLAATALEAGNHERTWDGRDNNGTPVAAGIYFYRLQAGTFIDNGRMALVK